MQADRLPPHDLNAEESVLGSILIDGMTITQIAGYLSAGDFYREINRQCFEVCHDLFQRNEATIFLGHLVQSYNRVHSADLSATLISPKPAKERT